MDSKSIYICSNYSDYDFKSDRIWRLDGSYEPFVYIIEEISTGMKYIGSKTAIGCLESDLGSKYFTSSSYVNWTRDEFKILEIIKCASNHDTIILEYDLIEENNAVYSDNFYNKSLAGRLFNPTGIKFTEKHKQKLRDKAKNRNVNRNAIESMRKFLSNSNWIKNNKGEEKRVLMSELKYYLDNGWELGRTNFYTDDVKEKWRKTYNLTKKEYIFTDDHKRKIGESSKGKVPVIDTETGKKFKCKIDDPKYLSGEYVHVSKGKKKTEKQKEKLKGYVTVRKLGSYESFRCKIDDPKYLSGEYIPYNKGLKSICPHCGKEGERNIMKRWHFDKCKYYKSKNIDLEIDDFL